MLTNCLKVGLTGGIASGKSTVCRIFSDLGAPIIDADKIAKSLFVKGSKHLAELKKRFGSQIFTASEELDRAKLREIVFNSKAELEWLNKLTHPLIAQQISNQLSIIKHPYVIIDIPLLINLNGEIPQHLKSLIERVLVVDCTIENQISRVKKRDDISYNAAKAIIKSQSSRKQKLALADDVIENNGELSSLVSKVNTLHQYYLNYYAAFN
ncbi:dephospho-CoA kinase [Aliikangiella sp. IMCC44632]